VTTEQQLIDRYGADVASINHNPPPNSLSDLVTELSSARDVLGSSALGMAYVLTSQARYEKDPDARAALLAEAERFLKDGVTEAPRTLRLLSADGHGVDLVAALTDAVAVLNAEGLWPELANRLADALNRQGVLTVVDAYRPAPKATAV